MLAARWAAIACIQTAVYLECRTTGKAFNAKSVRKEAK